MKNCITKVLQDSIAEEVGIEINDKLLSINNEKVADVIDYKYLVADEDIVLEIEKPDGEIWEFEIEKEYGEDIGLEFETGLMDNAKSCTNKCVFCFIDQLPKNMRETLYFKDDDSRLSFLQGNFVTLTNMKDEDIDRIIKYQISPINISVHTTNPELRVRMLKNRFSGHIVERMKKLSDAGIIMNCQIVLIPEYNNGEELVNTINDLYSFYPSVQNIAVVPVGVTKFRDGLEKLKTFDKESSRVELDIVSKLQEKFIKEIDNPFVRMSDEFYIVADREIPNAEFYDGYHQIEDGIGKTRNYIDAVNDNLCNLSRTKKGTFTIISGELSYNIMNYLADKINSANPNIVFKVVKVLNHFFGTSVTVTGLLTGIDVINTLKGNIDTEYLIMPNSMFRKGYEPGKVDEYIMLDDKKIIDIEKELGIKVLVVDFTGDDLIDKINCASKEEN